MEVRRAVKGVEVVHAGYLGEFFAKRQADLPEEDLARVVRILESWLSRHDRERLG